LLLRSLSLRSVLLHLLPQAIGLDQHILRISKLLLPLVAKPAKVGPALRASASPLDQCEVGKYTITAYLK
jgi:hypothetical protein